jgi:mannitol-specific phosphotransferase system IIBC component
VEFGIVLEKFNMVAGILSVSMMLILMMALDSSLTFIEIFLYDLIDVLTHANLHSRMKVFVKPSVKSAKIYFQCWVGARLFLLKLCSKVNSGKS